MPPAAKRSPRDYAQPRTAFSHRGRIDWRQPTTLDELVDLRRAEIQHYFCVVVRDYLRRSETTRPQLAQQCGIETDRFGRCLNGERWFSIEDMLRIEAVTGPILYRIRFTPTRLTNPALIAEYPRAAAPPPSREEPQAS